MGHQNWNILWNDIIMETFCIFPKLFGLSFSCANDHQNLRTNKASKWRHISRSSCLGSSLLAVLPQSSRSTENLTGQSYLSRRNCPALWLRNENVHATTVSARWLPDRVLPQASVKLSLLLWKWPVRLSLHSASVIKVQCKQGQLAVASSRYAYCFFSSGILVSFSVEQRVLIVVPFWHD